MFQLDVSAGENPNKTISWNMNNTSRSSSENHKFLLSKWNLSWLGSSFCYDTCNHVTSTFYSPNWEYPLLKNQFKEMVMQIIFIETKFKCQFFKPLPVPFPEQMWLAYDFYFCGRYSSKQDCNLFSKSSNKALSFLDDMIVIPASLTSILLEFLQ